MSLAPQPRTQIGGERAAKPEPQPRTSAASLPLVPDLDGRRYCKVCEASLPLAAFPAGKRRYLCRRHALERHKHPARRRVMSDALRRRADLVRKRCCADAKRVFGQPRVALLLCDVQDILRPLGADSSSARLVPADPSRPLAWGNVESVEARARHELLRAMQQGGAPQYCAALGQARVLEVTQCGGSIRLHRLPGSAGPHSACVAGVHNSTMSLG